MKKFVITACAALLFAMPAFAADQAAPVKSAAPAATQAKPAAVTAAKPAAKVELIDINSAKEETLKSIKGVGDQYSKKIVEGRPYAKKDQLVSKGIIPQALYDKIKDLIIAKQPKAAAATTAAPVAKPAAAAAAAPAAAPAKK